MSSDFEVISSHISWFESQCFKRLLCHKSSFAPSFFKYLSYPYPILKNWTEIVVSKCFCFQLIVIEKREKHNSKGKKPITFFHRLLLVGYCTLQTQRSCMYIAYTTVFTQLWMKLSDCTGASTIPKDITR